MPSRRIAPPSTVKAITAIASNRVQRERRSRVGCTKSGSGSVRAQAEHEAPDLECDTADGKGDTRRLPAEVQPAERLSGDERGMAGTFIRIRQAGSAKNERPVRPAPQIPAQRTQPHCEVLSGSE